MAFDAHDFFVRFVASLNQRDYETMQTLIHPDFVVDSPQSGERSVGFEAFVGQLRDYPGVDETTPLVAQAQVYGDEDRWAISPAYTVIPLASPNEYTTVLRSQYPDGSWWWVIGLCELRDGLLYRLENFFAPQMSAPLAESIPAFPHG